MSTENQAVDSSTETTQGTGILIHLDLEPCLNYASLQNSVPVLKSLEIENQSAKTVTGLVLSMKTEPGFARAKQWTFDRVAPGTSVSVSDLKVDLDPGYLNGLNEAERGEITFSLMKEDSVISQRMEEIRVLARDEWGGSQSMAELLAAFVMPNDPAIAKILKTAAEILTQHAH